MPEPIEIRMRGETEAEILIYDRIGKDEWTGEGATAKKFAADLKALGPVRRINVRIDSGGGNVHDGVNIYNALVRHPARVEVDIDGAALSAASIIAMAGDEIRIAANASMMIHNPMTIAMGDAGEMRKAAEVLDKMKAGLVTTYAARTKHPAEHIAALMDAETWMIGEEAVTAGFADSVTAAKSISNSYDLSMYRRGREMAAVLAGMRDKEARSRVAAQRMRLAALSAPTR